MENKKLETYLVRFIEWMNACGWSQRTVTDYSSSIHFFFTYLTKETSVQSLSDIDLKILNGFQTYLYHYKTKRKKRLTLGSQHNKLVAIRSFFRFLYKMDIIYFDTSSGLNLPKKRKRLPKGVMSEKEIERLLNQIDTEDILGFRDRTILEVLYSTGIRNSELRHLAVYDVDLSGLHLQIREGKNAKDRIVPLGEIAADYIEEYLQIIRPQLSKDSENQFLFLSKNGRQITYGNLVWMFHKYAKLAKLSDQFTPHSLRHSCATHMLKHGADLRYIQEMLGHTSVATTQVYTKVEKGDLKLVHRRCHPREKLVLSDSEGSQ